MDFVSPFHPLTPANEHSLFEYILIICEGEEIECTFQTSVQNNSIPNKIPERVFVMCILCEYSIVIHVGL